MKKSLIISTLFVLAFSLALPSVYATTGEIILDQSEFTLYRDDLINLPIFVEMSDYIHRPTLEILHDSDDIQKINLSSNGDSFQTVLGLNANWSDGEYIINLMHQGVILDSKSFDIIREKQVEHEFLIYENISEPVEPFLSLSVNKLVLERSSNEIIYVTGAFDESRFGSAVFIDITKPDGTIQNITSLYNSFTNSFVGLIPIDASWSSHCCSCWD